MDNDLSIIHPKPKGFTNWPQPYYVFHPCFCSFKYLPIILLLGAFVGFLQ